VHRVRPGDRGRDRAALRRVELTGEREIDRFESVAARVRRLAPQSHVAVIELGPGGTVGRHPAAARQLFVVVRGTGWVAGGDGAREPIAAGEAVLWDGGEEHDSGSDEGFTALVVEAEEIDV
jgi:quercetin dioxygenase-like cupin family protein